MITEAHKEVYQKVSYKSCLWRKESRVSKDEFIMLKAVVYAA